MKYTSIFYSKALQNLPKLGFLVFKPNHLATLDISSYTYMLPNVVSLFNSMFTKSVPCSFKDF
jgi:hypothetical protein